MLIISLEANDVGPKGIRERKIYPEMMENSRALWNNDKMEHCFLYDWSGWVIFFLSLWILEAILPASCPPTANIYAEEIWYKKKPYRICRNWFKNFRIKTHKMNFDKKKKQTQWWKKKRLKNFLVILSLVVYRLRQ